MFLMFKVMQNNGTYFRILNFAGDTRAQNISTLRVLAARSII